MFRANCINQTNNGVRLLQRGLCVLSATCLCLMQLTGCSKETPPATDVTLTIDNEGFLTFSGGGEDDLDEIDRLNHDIEELIEEYHETLGDNERVWTVSSALANTGHILQGTIYISKDESSLLSGAQTTRQLASFAYDLHAHQGFTAQDALESDPLTGVELSTKVQQAFRVLEPDAELLSTEMQGFLLNDDGTTQFLYMRIEEEPDPENPGDQPVERFYLYDPTVDAMAALEWPEQ